MGRLVLRSKHRAMCGDSTKPGDVAHLMAGEKCGLCFTSPPYAQQRKYTADAAASIADWDAMMEGVFRNLPMTEDGQVLVNLGIVHRDGEWEPYWDDWITWMRRAGWRRFAWYVWDQGSGFPGVFGGRCAPSHEIIFHFNRKPTTANKWVQTKDAGALKYGGAMGDHGWETDPSRVLHVQETKIPDSVWRVNRHPDATLDHPAIFPVELPAIAIRTWGGGGV